MGQFQNDQSMLPSLGAKEEMAVRKFLLDDGHLMTKGIVIPSDVVDAGNTPTTTLRPGLVLIRVEAAGANQGKYVQSGHANAPAYAGSAIFDAVILMNFVNMLGRDGVVEEKSNIGLRHGWVEDDQVIFVTATGSEQTELRDVMRLIFFETSP
jgi:hypothetical protein